MEAAEILVELERRGATVQPLEGGRIGVLPGSVLDDGLRAEIRAHKEDLLDEIQKPEVSVQVECEPSPFEQLQLDWRAAIERAQASFAENGTTPDLDLLEAAARLELKAAEWRRMDAAHFPQASRLLELLGVVYAGRLVATVNEGGKVTIRRKESTT